MAFKKDHRQRIFFFLTESYAQNGGFLRHIKANGRKILLHVIVPSAGAEDTGRPAL